MLALGQMLVILTRGIDLSVAANLALSRHGRGAARRSTIPGMPLPLLMLDRACAVGARARRVNGWLIGLLELPPIVVTLGTHERLPRRDLRAVRRRLGLAAPDADGFHRLPARPPARPDAPGVDRGRRRRARGLVLSAHTRFGRELYAIGSNPMAARYVGIRAGRRLFVRLQPVRALVAGLCGYLWVARYAVAYTEIAYGFELTVIAACVIGGVSIAGGVGSVAGAVLGALFLGVIGNALPVVQVSPFWQSAITGPVILVAVMLNARAERQRRQAYPASTAPEPRRMTDTAAPRASARPLARRAARPSGWLRWELLLVVLLVLVRRSVNASPRPTSSIRTTCSDATFNFSEKALIALPMALLIIAREIDLSVAGILALSSVAMGLAMHAGAGCRGLAAGRHRRRRRLRRANGCWSRASPCRRSSSPSARCRLFRGMALVVLGDQAYHRLSRRLRRLGPGLCLRRRAARTSCCSWSLAVVAAVVLHAHALGRRLYAIGNNPVAARFSGIAVDRYRFVAVRADRRDGRPGRRCC